MTAGTTGHVAANASLSSGAFFDEVPALTGLDPADPYPAYAKIFGPPLPAADGDVVIVTRFEDCSEVMRHPDVVSRRENARAFRGLTGTFLNVIDPPEHTRIRGLVNRAFTPRSIERLRPWLEDRVHSLLDDAVGKTTFDVISTMAYPLPVLAICELMDIPLEDRATIMKWSGPITYGVDLLAGRRSREDQSLYRSSFRDFRRYIRELSEVRRKTPGDDLLSRLVGPEDAVDRLTEQEIIMTGIGLLITGHETTVSLIGHGAVALSEHPELLESVAASEATADAFVEEVLRYDTPVQATVRVAARDLTLGGVDVRADAVLLCLLGAANRDPAQFEDPDRFDIERSNNRSHLAFGGGPHFCLGAALGRLEAHIALRALAARLVNPRPRPGGVAYDKSVMMRTQKRIDIDVDAMLPRPVPGGQA